MVWIEAFENLVGNESTGPEKRLVNFRRRAVDCADDLECEKVTQHSVREVEEGTDLLLVIGGAGHHCRIGIFQDYDQIPLVSGELKVG